MNYVVLAIPFFFALMGVELLLSKLLRRDDYRLSDSISDLSCGILQQVFEAFLKAALFAGYLFLYDRHRLSTVPIASTVAWVVCFLGVDFLYYWFHRTSHEVNAAWAAHVVHHQSEEFNLAVALRQGAFQGAFSWVFYLPLAVIGFPPAMFVTVSSVNTLYQFWIHTRLIGRLGPLEWVMNTPSHHRVHHGRNPKYIDRNHAGMFIVWDRLFGTFQNEEEEPVYGITKPLATWNPVWANFHYWAELIGQARQGGRMGDAIRLFLKPPGWQPASLGGPIAAPEVDQQSYRKYDRAVTRGLKAYVFGHFVIVTLATTVFLRTRDLGETVRLAAAFGILLSLLSLAGLLDGRPWAKPLEWCRLAVLAVVAAVVGLPAAVGALLLAAGSAVSLWRLRSAVA